jgi:hypothetical protein
MNAVCKPERRAPATPLPSVAPTVKRQAKLDEGSTPSRVHQKSNIGRTLEITDEEAENLSLPSSIVFPAGNYQIGFRHDPKTCRTYECGLCKIAKEGK